MKSAAGWIKRITNFALPRFKQETNYILNSSYANDLMIFSYLDLLMISDVKGY